MRQTNVGFKLSFNVWTCRRGNDSNMKDVNFPNSTSVKVCCIFLLYWTNTWHTNILKVILLLKKQQISMNGFPECWVNEINFLWPKWNKQRAKAKKCFSFSNVISVWHLKDHCKMCVYAIIDQYINIRISVSASKLQSDKHVNQMENIRPWCNDSRTRKQTNNRITNKNNSPT